uniref:Yippee domain-containing protein n=1 Tax=Heterorhabditis bacteriophora TaxID=37862 RepID=A0A1I7WBW6_HETBA
MKFKLEIFKALTRHLDDGEQEKKKEKQNVLSFSNALYNNCKHASETVIRELNIFSALYYSGVTYEWLNIELVIVIVYIPCRYLDSATSLSELAPSQLIILSVAGYDFTALCHCRSCQKNIATNYKCNSKLIYALIADQLFHNLLSKHLLGLFEVSKIPSFINFKHLNQN